jgi:hypothetical protein
VVSGGSWLVKLLLCMYSLVHVSLVVQPGTSGTYEDRQTCSLPSACRFRSDGPAC